MTNRELTATPAEIPEAAVRFASEALGETAGEHRDAMAHAAIAAAAPLIVAAELERLAEEIVGWRDHERYQEQYTAKNGRPDTSQECRGRAHAYDADVRRLTHRAAELKAGA